MNANIFVLSDNILMGKKPCPVFFEQISVFKGFYVSGKYILPSFYPDLEQMLSQFPKDLNIIVCEKGKARVNESLASLTGDILKENTHLKKAVLDYYKSINLPPDRFCNAEWEIPSKALGIVCENSLYQGYILKTNQANFIVLSLENEKSVFEIAIDQIENNQNKIITLKTFGLLEENIKELLAEFLRNKDGVKIHTIHHDLDVDIIVKARESNPKLEEYTAAILKKLSKFIYAEENISLSNVVFSLLSLTNQTLAVAESITGGNIVASLIKHNKGASKVLGKNFVVYSDQAKIDLLDVSPQTLAQKTAVSAEVAYQMAQGLAKNTNADLFIATTGYADGENAGECYIAIGDREKIHVYKNIFSGTRESVIENVTKAALFYLVKKLRSNDFVFK